MKYGVTLIRVGSLRLGMQESQTEDDVCIDAETLEELEPDERRYVQALSNGELDGVRKEGELRDSLNFAKSEMDEGSMNLSYAMFRSEYGISDEDAEHAREAVDESFNNLKNAESQLLRAQEILDEGDL